jgi:oxygen-independent coproporphyrinogen-3 oxidase
MASLLKYATFKPGAEITLEANPGTLTLENLQTLRVMGVNRLSYGAQTYDDAHLKRLGRAHDSFEIDRSVALAREAGFENISLDFIYGLPDETLESWNATLERALALRVEHFSLYGLILEENTSLGRRVLSGKLSLPPDDLTADMYLLALEKLEKAGYVQYEISNWARDSVEEFGSRHNMVYWRNSPYLGFGPGAHSCFTGYRYSVIKDPREYIKKLGAGESVIELEEAEELTTSLRLFDSIMLGLRMNKGISLSEIENEFGKPLEKFYPGLLDKLISLELLQEVTGAQGEKFISLTTRGRLLSNNVFMEFLPAKNLKGRD